MFPVLLIDNNIVCHFHLISHFDCKTHFVMIEII